MAPGPSQYDIKLKGSLLNLGMASFTVPKVDLNLFIFSKKYIYQKSQLQNQCFYIFFQSPKNDPIVYVAIYPGASVVPSSASYLQRISSFSVGFAVDGGSISSNVSLFLCLYFLCVCIFSSLFFFAHVNLHLATNLISSRLFQTGETLSVVSR